MAGLPPVQHQLSRESQLARAIRTRTPEEVLPLDRAQKPQGRATSNSANAESPRSNTGSSPAIGIENMVSNGRESDGNTQRLAWRSKVQPPAKEIKTGIQAANSGGRVPLTPSELKLKLST